MGVLTNIDQEGFLAPAFHAYPDLLRPDPLSGDNGPNFFGFAFATATYMLDHPEFGWLAFGGNVSERGGVVEVKPLDAFRARVYVAPLGLWLTLESGKFDSVGLNPQTRTLRIGLAARTRFTPQARLRVEQPAKVPGVGMYRPSAETVKANRDAYEIPLGASTTWVELSPK